MKHSPKTEYQVLKERFGDKLDDVLMFAMEVDMWPHEMYEYLDQFGIMRVIGTREYLMVMYQMAKNEGQNSTESYYETHIA
jgi:protein-L-isoaspartate O-methyltransferase